MDFHTTEPQGANPFGSTIDDPRELQKRVMAVMDRAARHRVKIPQPGAYWEEPGHHGTGREINLRKRTALRAAPLAASRVQVRKAIRLPPIPRRSSSLGSGTIALIAVGVIGTGLLAGYLVGRRKRKLEAEGAVPQIAPAHVGDDMCGFDLLGCEP